MGGAAGRWWGRVLIPKQYARLSNEVIYEQDLSQGQDRSPDSALPIT